MKLLHVPSAQLVVELVVPDATSVALLALSSTIRPSLKLIDSTESLSSGGGGGGPSDSDSNSTSSTYDATTAGFSLPRNASSYEVWVCCVVVVCTVCCFYSSEGPVDEVCVVEPDVVV